MTAITRSRKATQSFYGDHDPRDLPRYTYVEAARATGVPSSTIAAWVRGQWHQRKQGATYSEPVIDRPKDGAGRLSFFNLIEIHVLRSLRTNPDQVRLSTVREAVQVAEQQHGIERLLMHDGLRYSAGQLFLDRLGQLDHLTLSQQLVMRELFTEGLKRVEFDRGHLPTGLWPVERMTGNSGKRLILVSPLLEFGRSVVKRVGIPTSVIVDRLNAGESERAVLSDFGLKRDELREAIAYESAA